MRKSDIVIALATTCLLGLTGCVALVAGGAAGVGTLAYIKGELNAQIPASPSELQEAISDAIQSLELKELKAEADNLSGDYLLETGGDEKITIHYEKLKDRLIEVSIRVGVFGDENLSRVLLDEIKEGL